MVALKTLEQKVNGFGTLIQGEITELFNSTTDEYAFEQMAGNIDKTRSYILPLIKQCQAKSVLDVGCGVGTMVNELFKEGLDAYGVDLITLGKYWQEQGFDPERYFFVDPYNLQLPFQDNTLDFAFTLGVIEHIGTSDGHADRLPNYHEIRATWLKEIYRVIKPGGYMLIGGPNRKFPVDTAHGPDSKASKLELKLTKLSGATIHKTWGENFLWAYSDIDNYLSGLPYEMRAQSVKGYVYFSRVPKPFRLLSKWYIDFMPKFMLKTGFNPWVMALIQKK
ncbi:class I SAM-dependent methyltransferase [Methylophaga nitratireducenticrescens]|uniref:Methyltransferase n=1 Tax=Methylophaga nitratireducenticrescens TaxID=754476 RepID=I1XIP8_METNJ|nr:class I SAM-dependent methyltransferase [Methylophaga nitratireducenticrescens]AUZ84345.1 SAM-dependent methyltransferase [Methylophaga nitratireducenticrescens]